LLIQKPNQESTYQPVGHPARYSASLAPSLQARAPPLS
jgi:hypothetical protein